MMNIERRLAGCARLLLCATMALAGAVRAQPAPLADVDPPGRVARLSEAVGQVWIYSPDTAEWVGASRNQPLTTGDRLATEAGARAELQIGSTTVRVDASSELEVVELDDEHLALELHDGSAIANIRDPKGAGQLELTTEEGRFVTLRAGTYRFDRDNGKSDVTVYSGQARYEGPNSGLSVNAGQRAEFWIDSGGVAQYSTLAPVNDAFAAWSSERDRRVAGSIAERYVSPEMTGAAELDAYGRWEQTPDYGSVWIPTAVAADWSPYSQGRWTFVRPWGWTWVDAAPWGFAPFHYGRWVYWRNNWAWTPGTRVARPVYAPALVGWVGGPRGNVSVTIGSGPAVGWFPLAPREVYVPSYRVSSRYARDLNITDVTNVTVITNVFRNPQAPREFENRHRPRAITVVPSNVMTDRRPVGPAAEQYRHAPLVRDIVNDRNRPPVMLAPPIAAPQWAARGADPRGVRPPPGARPDARDNRRETSGRAPGLGDRPGTFPRDRNEADRERNRDGRLQPARNREPDRAGSTPAAPQPTLPAANPAAATPPPVTARPSGDPGRPSRDRERESGERRGVDPRAPAAAVTPPAAVAPPALQPQDRPTMRALPVQRGEERGDQRGDGRRSDDRRMDDRRPPRPAAPPQAQPTQPQIAAPARVERPAPPMAARPVEVQRPAAPAAPVALPVAPPPPARAEPRPEPQRPERPEGRGDERRRGEPREPR